jgi:hypothetical protein
MTFSTDAATPAGGGTSPSLVLLAAGPAAAVTGLQGQVAPALAVALHLPLLEPLNPLAVDAALAALAEGLPGLAPLPRDPGLPLADGRHWAAALGAWRQPALVVLAAEQLHTGLPAALTALLAQWQVPCLGLVQWGGSWEAQQRRLEGLPWLGCLAASKKADAAEDAAAALRSACAARWAVLEGQRLA